MVAIKTNVWNITKVLRFFSPTVGISQGFNPESLCHNQTHLMLHLTNLQHDPVLHQRNHSTLKSLCSSIHWTLAVREPLVSCHYY